MLCSLLRSRKRRPGHLFLFFFSNSICFLPFLLNSLRSLFGIFEPPSACHQFFSKVLYVVQSPSLQNAAASFCLPLLWGCGCSYGFRLPCMSSAFILTVFFLSHLRKLFLEINLPSLRRINK
ncbi:uncharacterized protein [Primulina huaijiensis]|uniref:uncharacterized protein isoform X3 n=1 Tax=Primulina huaijiensis TaxID=1492673 RepID=UPI003CC706F4